jgi:tetratricopeptide (TPR) repeat protein
LRSLLIFNGVKGRSFMTRTRWSLVLLGLLLGSASARAQNFLYYNPYAYDYRASSAMLNYQLNRGHGGVSFAVGGVAVQGFGVAPLYGPYWGPAYPPLVAPYYAPVVNQQVTVITYRPPPVVLPGPFIVDDLTIGVVPRREPEIPLNPRPLPDRNKPKEPDAPKKPMQPEQLPAKPPVKPDMPRIPHPEVEPRAENARLIALGKEAFADVEYGRAAQRFRQAAQVLPNDGKAHFLLAQALFALGQYQDAVDAIYEGMDVQRNWPAANFKPLELYGEHVAFYPDHLRSLEDAVLQHPNDAVVLFLYAYQLWFDGRKDEARVLFQRALPAGAEAPVIDRFLRALPGGAGV